MIGRALPGKVIPFGSRRILSEMTEESSDRRSGERQAGSKGFTGMHMRPDVQGRFPLVSLTPEADLGLSVRFESESTDIAAEKGFYKILIAALRAIP